MRARSKSGSTVAQRWRVQRRPPFAKPAPLDATALDALALGYVGRYATTRARLAAYLERKLRERGWAGEEPGDGAAQVAAIVARLADLRYVDDRAFADQRAAALGRRGYGARRVGEALRAAGIEIDDARPARESAEAGAWEAALAFARRRRIGPFAAEPCDRERRQKALGAMLRAGHPLPLARRIVEAPPGTEPDPDD